MSPQVVPLAFIILASKQGVTATLINNSLFCNPKVSFNLKTYVPPVKPVNTIWPNDVWADKLPGMTLSIV